MRIKKDKLIKNSTRFFQYYWPVFLVIIFFILKSHLFNHWVGFSLAFWKTRTLTTLGLISALSLPTIFLKRKSIFKYSMILSVLTSLIFFSYYVYNSYAGGILSLSAIGYAGQLVSVTDIIIKLITPESLFFFADLALLVIIYLLLRKNITNNAFIKYKKNLKIIILFTLLMLCSIAYSASFIKEKSLKHLFIPIDSLAVVQKNGIINYASQDLFRFFNKKKKATDEEIQLIKSFDQKKENKENRRFNGIAKDKNIIFVQLESMQDFVIDLKIDEQEVTPNLNAFYKENYRFNNFYFQTGPGNTSDSEFTVLNSLYPLINQSVNFDYPTNYYNSLISNLNKEDYETILMHGYRKDFWNREMIYENYGINKFYGMEDYTIGDRVGWGISDEDFFEQSLKYLDEAKQPFFSLMVTLSNHSPYNIPEDKKDLKIQEGIYEELTENYLHGARYTDKAFGQLIKKLKEKDLYNGSVIVVYGDHGAGLQKFTNNDFKSLINDNDILGNYDLLLERVPFFVHLPNNTKGIIDDPMSLLDVYPTITNLIGIDTPRTLLGKDMFNYQDSSVFIKRNSLINKSIITENVYYIYPQSEIYEEGKCFNWRKNTELKYEKCQKFIEEMESTFKVNDLVIKTNNLKLLE